MQILRLNLTGSHDFYLFHKQESKYAKQMTYCSFHYCQIAAAAFKNYFPLWSIGKCSIVYLISDSTETIYRKEISSGCWGYSYVRATLNWICKERMYLFSSWHLQSLWQQWVHKQYQSIKIGMIYSKWKMLFLKLLIISKSNKLH